MPRRAERLTRAATMLAEAGDAIAVAVSEDVGHRSAEETRFETFGAVNAFRHAATRVENWMQPARHGAARFSIDRLLSRFKSTR
jgi:acyl-CoA reductase-like NAD-dependent aldehyde dehydrogenase